jgi:hypothetical protein
MAAGGKDPASVDRGSVIPCWLDPVSSVDLGSVHETECIPLTEYIPIFRVPEYFECGGEPDLRLGFIE